MRRRLSVVAAAAAVLALPPAASATATAPAQPYVVALEDRGPAPERTADRLAARLGLDVTHVYDSALAGFAAELTRAQAAALRDHPRVEGLERDVVFRAAGVRTASRAAARKGGSAGQAASAELLPSGVRRIGAAASPAAGAAGVAILDSGIDLDHPELQAVDAVNCVEPSRPAQDDNGHGTHVAGIVGARADGTGVIGVAPDARVFSVKVLDRKSRGSLSTVLCGIDWVTANAARLGIGVANMSLGGPGTDDGDCGRRSGDAQHQAICRSVAAGVTYVAAAGNASAELERTAPAAYREVLAVTAMTDTDGLPGGRGTGACVKRESDDSFATFSNHAAGGADLGRLLAAPGTCVSSTGLDGPPATYNGTSQAAPHVAGAIARCLGAGGRGPCAGAAPAQVVARVTGDAQRLATPSNGFAGDPLRAVAGRAYGALVTSQPY